MCEKQSFMFLEHIACHGHWNGYGELVTFEKQNKKKNVILEWQYSYLVRHLGDKAFWQNLLCVQIQGSSDNIKSELCDRTNMENKRVFSLKTMNLSEKRQIMLRRGKPIVRPPKGILKKGKVIITFSMLLLLLTMLLSSLLLLSSFSSYFKYY